MIVFFGLLVFAVMILYLISKDKYKALTEVEEAKMYGVQALLPLTLFLLELFKYRYISKYDRKISKALESLYGSKFLDKHLRLYYSSKLAVMIVALIILTCFGAVSKKVDISYMVFTLSAPIAVFFIFDKDLENKQKKKYDSIKSDFPDVVSKLVLLVNAGMNVNRAWEKICTETKRKAPLYQELKITYMQIQGGKPESEAYEEFARRCKVKEITKFITLIIQNLKKGSGDMVPLLKLQAEECWELRKMRAKQRGEEASTKLIIPMMIMFIGILIIVVLPAIMQLSSL